MPQMPFHSYTYSPTPSTDRNRLPSFLWNSVTGTMSSGGRRSRSGTGTSTGCRAPLTTGASHLGTVEASLVHSLGCIATGSVLRYLEYVEFPAKRKHLEAIQQLPAVPFTQPVAHQSDHARPSFCCTHPSIHPSIGRN
jgi:hypothetical protein